MTRFPTTIFRWNPARSKADNFDEIIRTIEQVVTDQQRKFVSTALVLGGDVDEIDAAVACSKRECAATLVDVRRRLESGELSDGLATMDY